MIIYFPHPSRTVSYLPQTLFDEFCRARANAAAAADFNALATQVLADLFDASAQALAAEAVQLFAVREARRAVDRRRLHFPIVFQGRTEDDIVIEVWLRFRRSLPRLWHGLEPLTLFRQLSVKIRHKVHHILVEFAERDRKAIRALGSFGEDVADPIDNVVDPFGPDESFADERHLERWKAVAKVLDGFGDIERRVIWLHYVEGEKLPRIARVLAMSELRVTRVCQIFECRVKGLLDDAP
jgi:DNA-directed RNA polymerase specialized sigma24 family protein